MKTILLIGLGSFIGGVLRHLLSSCLNDSVVKGFPLGTLAVNLAGCLLIGILYGLFDRGTAASTELRLFLAVGLCGGFTTFSTFMNENFLMAPGSPILHPPPLCTPEPGGRIPGRLAGLHDYQKFILKKEFTR